MAYLKWPTTVKLQARGCVRVPKVAHDREAACTGLYTMAYVKSPTTVRLRARDCIPKLGVALKPLQKKDGSAEAAVKLQISWRSIAA